MKPVSYWVAVLLATVMGNAAAFELSDPFSVREKLASSPAKAMLADKPGDEDSCSFGQLGSPLGLAEAVERALCNNPKSHEAWAHAKVQAALVGVKKAEYLPQASANLGLAKIRNRVDVGNFPILDQNSRITSRTRGLKMSWVLADFGLRSAHVEQAKALLEAANAIHDATLQEVLITAAQAYYDTVSAYAAVDAGTEAESAAKESLQAAGAKFKAGVGLLTDQLQAQTAYSQARLERIKAEGDLKNAQGMLATAMGLPANAPVHLTQRNGKLEDTSFVKSVDELLEEARQNHPGLVSIRAQLDAAKSNIKAMRAEGRPTVVLASEITRSDQLGQPPSIGLPVADTYTRNESVGVQVNIPLFEGFGRSYRVQSAQAEAEVKQAEMEKIEQQVMLDVWKNYQLLNSEQENIRASDELVTNATEAFNVAQGRYKAGVGNILELLNVQTALANARQQRIKSVANWHTARLKLAASVGKVGLWAISDPYADSRR